MSFRVFENNGGKFLVSEAEFITRLHSVKAFVFDWDGVFTNGDKNNELQSSFNEVDSMGSNMLRFAFYLKHRQLPAIAIISGENNKTAFTFTTRECFHANYFKVANKTDAMQHFCAAHGILAKEIAYVFDDVLDLSMAQQCGLRIFIPRKANPMFNEYVIKNKLADYLTYSQGGHFAVREACELMISGIEAYDEVITHRVNYSEHYAAYITQRRATKTKYFTITEGKITEVHL